MPAVAGSSCVAVANVNLEVAPDDPLFAGDLEQYLQVGISALDNIKLSLLGAKAPQSILDFSCGFGRGAMPVDAPDPTAVDPVQQASSHDGGSTSAAQDAQAGSYVAEIVLGKTVIGTDQGPIALSPGMQVTADIKIGRRTLISYLLSPLDILKHNAMRQ